MSQLINWHNSSKYADYLNEMEEIEGPFTEKQID